MHLATEGEKCHGLTILVEYAELESCSDIVIYTSRIVEAQKDGDPVRALLVISVGIILDVPAMPSDTEGTRAYALVDAEESLGRRVAINSKHV